MFGLSTILIGQNSLKYDAGVKSYNEKKYETAIRLFTESISENPSLVEAWYLKGLSYYSLNLFQLATIDFSVFLSHKPNDKDALVYRSYHTLE